MMEILWFLGPASVCALVYGFVTWVTRDFLGIDSS